MQQFEYAPPTTKKQAVKLLSEKWGETEVLAGGTDLLSLIKDNVVTPQRLVSIKQIKELRGINFSSRAGLCIGAMVTLQELIDNSDVRRHYPALTQAAEGIRSPQVRSMGTVAGDLCQRPRCWYYRAGFGLLARDKDGESLVLKGDHRYHAILGNSGPAYFVNTSSLAPPLIAFEAKIKIFGTKGEREIALEDFFVTPDSEEQREYDMRPNEIITEILLPPSEVTHSSTYEIRQREGLDWPLATASVAIKLRRNRVRSARVVLGHVAPVPWPSSEASTALKNKQINEETAQAIGNVAVKEARSLGQNGYKIQLSRVAVKRAILNSAHRA